MNMRNIYICARCPWIRKTINMIHQFCSFPRRNRFVLISVRSRSLAKLLTTLYRATCRRNAVETSPQEGRGSRCYLRGFCCVPNCGFIVFGWDKHVNMNMGVL
ncbi:unnamed protein product [Scytosiphon promiscuus]